MRIALAQINPIIGDIAGNYRLISDALDQAKRAGVQLVVFPELAVIGYPPKDLLLKPAVIQDCVEAVNRLAERCTGIAAIIGYPSPSDTPDRGRPLYNAAVFCRDGRVAQRFVKTLLPTYDVFDEQRYFEPELSPASMAASNPKIVEFSRWKLGVTICEDLWNDPQIIGKQLYRENPIADLARRGADLLINCSASPFVLGKHDFRIKLFSHAARTHNLPLLYCNQVGGNDELVFDGNSCAFDSQGNLVAQAKDFEEDLLVIDLPDDPASKRAPITPARIEKHKQSLESVYHALVLGLRDYCRKCGFRSIVLGLSGGVDSALTAALAVAALGPQNVRGVAMPSRFSSDHSLADAKELAHRLRIKFSVIPINQPHAELERLLTPHFEGKPPDAAEENLQARLRGLILMSLSNKFSSLLVTTGNKSELAVGYCTLYGDMAGGLAVISDVPKTMVWDLARWINQSPASPLLKQFSTPVIPQRSIDKVPSAELRPNQTDQDTLPPYDVLDQIIEHYVEEEQSAQQIISRMPDTTPELIMKIVRMIDANEYKRKQAAPGLKVTTRAFGFGRRMPIAQKSTQLPKQGGLAK